MNEQECLSKMVAPGAKRDSKWRGGVIQIWVTRTCDLSCYSCTQGSNLAGSKKSDNMTPDQFREACRSLKGYFGVVGMFGGNPATHPQFEELCAVMREEVPAEQRGLWCNNPLGKGKVMAATFNPRYSNLNVHMSREAYNEFKRDWPASMPVGLEDSRHSPVHLAMKDLDIPEEERWELISRCDINQYWSAMIGVFRGELRAWFCEVAGAQSILHQEEEDYPDTGMPLMIQNNAGFPYPWWQYPMQTFAHQVRKHCHECAVPLRGYGQLAVTNQEDVEQTSKTHFNIFKPKKKGRAVELVTTRADLDCGKLGRTTDYLGNRKK